MQGYLNQEFPLGLADLRLHRAEVLDDVADLREESAEAPGACRSNLRSSAGFAGAACFWGRLGGGRRGPLR
jgi:hypothetical protein